MYVEMNPEKVKALREEKGLSRRELADAAEVSVRTVGKVERGGRVRSSSARSIILALGEEPSLECGRIIERA
jgi:transcriptional regulator with XRE-family HTH domain